MFELNPIKALRRSGAIETREHVLLGVSGSIKIDDLRADITEVIRESEIRGRQLIRDDGLPFYLSFDSWRSRSRLLRASDNGGDNNKGECESAHDYSTELVSFGNRIRLTILIGGAPCFTNAS